MSTSDVLTTTIDPRHRTITLLLETGDHARFALVQRPNGDIGWSFDIFARSAPGMPLEWREHGGRLTVAQVIASVPACRRDVLRWTAEEIEDDGEGLDIFARDARRRAVERLAAELRAAEAPAA